jgi:hypothetical protein
MMALVLSYGVTSLGLRPHPAAPGLPLVCLDPPAEQRFCLTVSSRLPWGEFPNTPAIKTRERCDVGY